MSEHEYKDFGFFEQLARIQWLLHRYRLQKYRAFGPMGDPHRGQGRVLSLLKLQPEISQKELGYLLNMRPQSLGELLIKLERAGYITRTTSDVDRRILNIKLTEEGKKAADAREQSENGSLLDCLSEEEQSALGDYLSRIIASLERLMDVEPEPEPGFGWGFGGHRNPGFDGAPPSHGPHHPGFNGGPQAFGNPFGNNGSPFHCGHGDRPETPPEDQF